MKLAVSILGPVLLGFLPIIASAQSARVPSTLEDGSPLVKAVRLLESDPFNKDGDRLRMALTLSLMPVPQVRDNVCSAPFGPVAEDKKYKYGTNVLAQSMFSAAAFMIEHPELATASLNARVAGVDGALKMYEAMVRVEPKARHSFLDGLLQKRERGELRAYVDEVWKRNCAPTK